MPKEYWCVVRMEWDNGERQFREVFGPYETEADAYDAIHENVHILDLNDYDVELMSYFS